MDNRRESAAVDTDFILHLVETEGISDINAAVSLLFEELNIIPLMHELVYDNELNCHGSTLGVSQVKALELFSLGLIHVKPLNDIIRAPGAEAYYKILFEEIYYKFSGSTLPSIDLFSEWVTTSSLGEVHSVVMCFFIGCGIFLSDDRKARSLKTYLINGTAGFEISIYSRQMACERAKEIGTGKLSRNLRRALSHR